MKVSSQQKVKAEQFNFTELANRQASQSFQKQGEHELDGGWKYLKGNMPIPPHAKIMKQNIAPVPSPATVEASFPATAAGISRAY